MSDTVMPLVPGVLRWPTGPLARYRSAQVGESLPEFLKAATQPGDMVLELGAQDTTYIRETVQAGRRMLALNVNPLATLWISQELDPIPMRDLQTATTRLGDQPKGTHPFSAYVQSLYASKCPVCQRTGVADWFAWDREAKRPFAKRVRCTHCEKSNEGAATAEDIALAKAFPVQSGPAYYFALGRVAQSDDPLRERAADLLGLYTPRNLGVLMDIVYRISQLNLPSATRDAVNCVLLDVLDHGSSLNSYDEPTARPKSLRPAQRYLEWNIWYLLQRSLEAYPQVPALGPKAEGPRVSLQVFLASSDLPYLVWSQPLQTVARLCAPHSIATMIIHPEVPDATPWALSALLAAWLGIGASLRGFIGRRRLDWDWYRRGLSIALRHALPLLKPSAPVLCVLPNDNLITLDVTLDSISDAALEVELWIACHREGFRLRLSSARQRETLPPEPSEEQFYTRILQQRCEPTPQPLLEAAAIVTGAFEPAPKITPAMRTLRALSSPAALAQQLIWFTTAEADPACQPLADRVEQVVLDLLQQQRVWLRTSIEREIYARFPGAMSPEPAIVRACIQAYAQPTAEGEGYIELRPEDYETVRENEVNELRRQVLTLGSRLGLTAEMMPDLDVTWSSQNQCLYRFRCTATALLSRHLLGPSLGAPERRCLVIPGGRAALAALKLRRDPRLLDSTLTQRWTFVKFRHLRRMIAEVSQRSEIEVYLGLDPIVEQEQVQIPLPLQ